MIDGTTRQMGVDSSSDVLSLPRFLLSHAVNRKFRGGINRTRDPFYSLDLQFDTDATRDTFKHGNISGVFGYKKLTSGTQPYAIVACGDSILAGRIYGRTLSFRTIYKGISPQWEHSFFVQAENILVWQNGKDLPLYWDGITSTMKYVKDAPQVNGSPMPVGNIMVYAHGRIFVATEENIVYASNHLYSQGIGANTAILKFSETQYWTGGDGFGTPSLLGRITGASVIPRHPEPNGHGPVIIFCENGAWTINAAVARENWQADPNIQTIALVGRGCGAPHSVTSVNNDLFYRCTDRTIASFKHAVSSENVWANTSLSREVQQYLDFDITDTVQFSDGIHFNNRLLMTCAHRREQNDIDGFGNHRFALGMVLVDLDKGSALERSGGFLWDGLWTGPRTAGIIDMFENLEKRALFFSFDADGENRVYENLEGNSNDRLNNIDVPIRSWFINAGLFGGEDSIIEKKLTASRLDFDEAAGEVGIQQEYQPDFYPCWS